MRLENEIFFAIPRPQLASKRIGGFHHEKSHFTAEFLSVFFTCFGSEPDSSSAIAIAGSDSIGPATGTGSGRAQSTSAARGTLQSQPCDSPSSNRKRIRGGELADWCWLRRNGDSELWNHSDRSSKRHYDQSFFGSSDLPREWWIATQYSGSVAIRITGCSHRSGTNGILESNLLQESLR